MPRSLLPHRLLRQRARQRAAASVSVDPFRRAPAFFLRPLNDRTLRPANRKPRRPVQGHRELMCARPAFQVSNGSVPHPWPAGRSFRHAHPPVTQPYSQRFVAVRQMDRSVRANDRTSLKPASSIHSRSLGAEMASRSGSPNFCLRAKMLPNKGCEPSGSLK